MNAVSKEVHKMFAKMAAQATIYVTTWPEMPAFIYERRFQGSSNVASIVTGTPGGIKCP